MNKIRKGDTVVALAGRDRGRRGLVTRVLLDSNGKPARVLVEGLNTVSVFTRPNPHKNEPGGVNKREAPMPAAKVAVIDPETDLPARVKIGVDAEGKKIRTFHVSAARKKSAAGAVATKEGQ